ncbi:MAG: polysaccharide deacetylase family protein [Acidobacteria bacterium]|nr:polysaccharide deacetylase family protein [Acidobacteriota bacterium]
MGADRSPASAILTFHSLDRSGSVISFDPDAFGAAMETLRDSGVAVVSLREALRRPGAIALTFDDAFVNFAEQAWPVLSRLNLPATLFVVTGHAGGHNDWPSQSSGIPRLPLLDWPRLRELAAAGVELGAHSHTHPDLRALAPAQLSNELALPAQIIQDRTGFQPAAYAYPAGLANASVRSRTAALYEVACGTRLGYWTGREPLHDLPRLDAYYLRGSLGPAHVFTGRGHRWIALRAFARRIRELLQGR